MSDKSPPDIQIFDDAGDFVAWNSAETWLERRGFSVGSMQAHSPTGFMYGEYSIAKWRNMNKLERATLHGTINADSARNGPVTLRLGPLASRDAVKAFHSTEPSQEKPDET